MQNTNPDSPSFSGIGDAAPTKLATLTDHIYDEIFEEISGGLPTGYADILESMTTDCPTAWLRASPVIPCLQMNTAQVQNITRHMLFLPPRDFVLNSPCPGCGKLKPCEDHAHYLWNW